MRPVSQFLILAGLAATACGQRPTPAFDFAAQRQRMIQQQLMTRGINDARVLAAMAKVPREEFVTGSGYQAAILAELVSDVYSIEIVEPLAKSAERSFCCCCCGGTRVSCTANVGAFFALGLVDARFGRNEEAGCEGAKPKQIANR